MKLTPGTVAAVTGAGSGIGRALAQRFAAEGAKAVVCVDRDEPGAKATAAGIGGVAFRVDVAKEDEIAGLIETVERDIGPIDLFCANAGVGLGRGIGDDDADWMGSWNINVMAHVYAARALVPRMVERGHGYILTTASAAGLLTNLDSATYTVTKHAAVAFAEWLSMNYGDAGVKVSCLCPQGVRTPMLMAAGTHNATLAAGGVVEPEDAAEAVVQAIRDERFLVLPHPEVAGYYVARATDTDRWLAGMRRLQHKLDESGLLP